MVEGDAAVIYSTDVTELSRETGVISIKNVEITKEVEVKAQWVYKDGVYLLDFTHDPLMPSNWEIHEHKGKAFEYNPEDIGLFSLKDLELKEDATIDDCIKRLKKWGLNPLPANMVDFISKVKPVVPKNFSGTVIQFLGTIFRFKNTDKNKVIKPKDVEAKDKFVYHMYYADFTNKWIKKHDSLIKELGPCSRFACY